MNKIELTAEQKQAAAALEDFLNEIQIMLEWTEQLSINISSRFFGSPNTQNFISDSSISIQERFNKAAKLLWDYDMYSIYTDILSYLISVLKEIVDNIVDSVYK